MSTTDLTEDATGLGLTDDEAAQRLAQGLGNADPNTGDDDRTVIRRNLVTFFNGVLATLILALLIAGEFRDGLFVGAVVFANVAISTAQELIATRRLRALRALTAPHATVWRGGRERAVPGDEVVQGDVLVLRRGDQVVADGRIVDGGIEVDESLLTGESTTVRRDAGELLHAGVFCVAGEARYRAARVGAESYALSLSAQAQELVRRTTPLMVRFNRLLRVLLIATGVLAAVLFIQFNIADRGFTESLKATTATVTTIVPVGLLLGITVVTAVGAVRVSRAGAIVQDMYAVEALNYVDVIAFDKTGTLTSNRLLLHNVRWRRDDPSEVDGADKPADPPAPTVDPADDERWLAAFATAAESESPTGAALAAGLAGRSNDATATTRVAFRSDRRWSAITLERPGERGVFVLGAPETVLAACSHEGDLPAAYAEAAARGLRGLVFAECAALPDPEAPLAGLTALALITFEDELRDEVREAFALMETLEIAPKVISGDHPRTVVGILAQLGVEASGVASGDELERLPDEALDEVVERTMVFGRVSPPLKARLIEALKRNGHFVAMVGDGANDVLALRAGDVAVAMASGTAIARGVAGIVLLRDSFTALIRGTREATFVLGNTGRLAKLFLTKSVYAYVLILATNMLGLEFPFLPRQGGVVSGLSLGIPALLVSMSNPPPSAMRAFTARIVRFALPAGVALGVAAMLLQFTVEGLIGRSVEESRTLVSLTLTIVGLAFFVEVLGLEDASMRVPWRPLFTIAAAVALAIVLVATVRNEAIREFFAFAEVSTIGWIAVGVASLAALLGQFLLSRYWQQLLDVLIARPGPEERPRGRML